MFQVESCYHTIKAVKCKNIESDSAYPLYEMSPARKAEDVF